MTHDMQPEALQQQVLLFSHAGLGLVVLCCGKAIPWVAVQRLTTIAQDHLRRLWRQGVREAFWDRVLGVPAQQCHVAQITTRHVAAGCAVLALVC